MLTQNPIIGRARKKLGGVYARTLYGKNVIQTCPPPNKGRETPGEAATRSMFGELSKLSNQLDASLLNSIYYQAPQGRSRRGEYCRQLSSLFVRDGNTYTIQPSNLLALGSNQAVSNLYFSFTPDTVSAEISVSDLSAIGGAITTEKPLLMLLCPSKRIFISLLPYTTLNDGLLTLDNLSTTLIGQQCYIYPLWRVNVGTPSTPILEFGSYNI